MRKEGGSSSNMPRTPNFRRNTSEGGGSSPSMAVPSHFFKVVLDQAIQSGCIEIPYHFVKKHGNTLSEYASLEVPPGKLWRVELKKSGGKAWLHKSFEDFVEYYSMKDEYILVFKYHGRSFFHVSIYDTSTMEIKYPIDSNPEGSKHGGDTEDDDDNDGEEADELSDDDDEQDTKEDGNARGSALERAKLFQSPNPFFVVKIQPKFVSDTPHMNIPVNHARSYLAGREKNLVFLHGEDGKVWPVKYHIYSRDKSLSYARLYYGWKTFVHAYRLKAGDVCIFELINSTSITYKVAIFRKSDAEEISDPKDKVLQRAKAFECKNPHFVVYIGRACISNVLAVPKAHSMAYLKGSKEGGNVIVFHGPNGGTWEVLCHNKPCYNGRAVIARGWKSFISHNHLQVGDACVFEMIPGQAVAYRVVIFRGADDA